MSLGDVVSGLWLLRHICLAVGAVLPLPSLACTSPYCANLDGLSEMHLVWRKGVCGHCRAAKFCSAACLRRQWSDHKDAEASVVRLLPDRVCLAVRRTVR
jgi:hypothetical protein